MKANPGIEAARRLAHIGYRFMVNGETIKARYEGQGDPDPVAVSPLLDLVRQHKEEVRAFLSRPQTCADCGHFQHSYPNPTQSWGECNFSGKWGYGLRPACVALVQANPGLERVH
jgi:hypothetical protein